MGVTMRQKKKNSKQSNVLTKKYFRDLFNRKIYEVPASRVKEYAFYQNRFTVSIMLGILLNNFRVGNEVVILISLGLMIMLEFRYRKSFLPSLNVRQHMNVDKDVSAQALLMNSILYVLMAILFVVYGLTGDVTQTMQWVWIALGVGCGGLAFMYISERFAVK